MSWVNLSYWQLRHLERLSRLPRMGTRSAVFLPRGTVTENLIPTPWTITPKAYWTGCSYFTIHSPGSLSRRTNSGNTELLSFSMMEILSSQTFRMDIYLSVVA